MSTKVQFVAEEVDKAVSRYRRVRDDYKSFARNISELVGSHCGSELIHTTQFRAKSVDSFERKCYKFEPNGRRRYANPLVEITDLAGVRIIVFVKESVNTICSEIKTLLHVKEIEDIGERVYSGGKFGYQSTHLLVTLGVDRRNLIENKKYKDMVCEIQVRTILQHAWAEMEHDIQYKSEQEIPLDLKKRFSALAGLLEIADREFQAIQKDSNNLKQIVKDELLTELTQQHLSDSQQSTGSAQQYISARELISSGRYNEAIELYSKKIKDQPNAYTLYIGRARARFLTGDVSGSIADLDAVDKIAENTVTTATLRSIIQGGDDPTVRQQAIEKLTGQFGSDHSTRLNLATESLEKGDGAAAFSEYSELEANGYNKAFAIFGQAMACALEKDIDGARRILHKLQIRPATPMSISICALACIIDALAGESVQEDKDNLEKSISEFPAYSYSVSPMRFLESGLQKKESQNSEDVKAVFRRIGGAEN